MRKNTLIVSLLLVSIIFLMSGVALALPTPAQCTNCHGLDDIYQEWSSSPHGLNGITCYQCHTGGIYQHNPANDIPPLERGFQVLGYLINEATATWVRVDRKQVCTRCHEDAHHVMGPKSQDECVNCHMPIQGLTTYRVHFFGTDVTLLQTIKKYVTREHRVHSWKIPKFGTTN